MFQLPELASYNTRKGVKEVCHNSNVYTKYNSMFFFIVEKNIKKYLHNFEICFLSNSNVFNSTVPVQTIKCFNNIM